MYVPIGATSIDAYNMDEKLVLLNILAREIATVAINQIRYLY